MKKQITILVADDNSFMRDILRIFFAAEEDMVLIAEAENGEEAILLAAEHSPDIIIMDINMSPVNGFEATRKILRQNPEARIIGLSLNKEVSYYKNLLRLGARGYLTKSAPHTEIMIAIREVMAGRKYIDKSFEEED